MDKLMQTLNPYSSIIPNANNKKSDEHYKERLLENGYPLHKES